jgi:hypothetical protein
MASVDKGMIYDQMAGLFARQNKFEEYKNYLDLLLKHGFAVFKYLKLDRRLKTLRESAIYTSFLGNNKIKGH